MESSSELIVEETIRQDQQCVLRRGRRSPDAQPILTLEPRWDHPSPEVIARLEREFALRGELSPDWALVPLALESNHGKTALIFADAGGIPLDQCGEMPWPLAKFWPVAIRICAALAQIHDKGLVHKDVKPANILLNPETGQVRLMNFGLATRLPRERPALDPPELIAGTLAYMAPEQTGRMNRSVDSRSDLYSLGVTFYELLTGALPFAANDPTDWVHCHLAREPVAPTSRNRSLPAPLSDLVLKLLAKSPEARYQTAAGLQSDLERLAAQWSEHHDLTPFPLGSHDKSDRLLIPEKLYGRSREVRDLHTAFERVVTQGAPQVVLVAGYSGAGKSSLIGELHKVISLPRGIFAAGKFEQHKRGIPYASLAQAFQGLIRQLLVRPEDELRRWRETILAQVEDRGQLIIDLVPELEYIIGRQPALPALPGQESQNRFHTVFAQFVAAFARREHPLVLFLDDLQWQDGASLRLVEHLVTHPELRFLLFVGAYRNNEVSATHPLMVTLDAIRAAGVAITDLPLGPLQLADVTRLVSETLRMPEPRVQPLARLVHDKTGGNPFFAIQFLTAIHDQRLLFFDQEEQGWRWDLDAIRGRGFSDNVADLMVARLRGLPRPTVDALKALAFLGNAASTAHLALVEGLSEDQIDRDLWEALRAGLIVRAPGGYRFLHDRIQEAADSMIPAATRPHEHLRIARLLLAGLSAEAREKNQEEVPADNLDRNLEDNLFSLVRHFNQGVDLVTDESERDLVRRLNVAAGHRAKAAIAYGLAREYFARAFQRLPEDAWQSSYDETFALALDLSECELLAGNFERADELFGIILDAARTNADRGKTQRLRSRLYRTQGRYDAALAVLTDGLRAFGLTFPDSDGAMKDALDLACAETEVLLGGRSIASLLEAPTVTDPAAATVIAMLSEAQACAYPINSPLFPLIVRKAVNHSLRFGNCSESCFAYSMHAVLLGRQWGDMTSALAFSELSLKLADKFGETEYSGVVRLIHAAAVSFWAQPFAVGRPYLEDAFRICIATGDLGHASATGIFTSWLLLESGAALTEIRAASEKFAAFARQVKNEVMQQTVLQMVSFADCLDGDPPDATVPGCAPFNQVERKRLFDETHFLPGNAYGYILAQLVGLIHGRFEESLAAARAAQAYLSGIVGTPGEASHHFYYALALAAVCRTAAEDQKGELADSLAAEIAILKTQADTCPANYFDRHALALAEQARLEGAHDQAMQLYDRAISAAHANGFGLNEALACELAGEFYLSLGLERNARGYLRDARAGYLHWGAAGKVKQLDRRHPRLAAPAPSPTSTIAAPAQQLDLPNVVKAAQAVAGEIVLGRLIEKLLTIVVDLAGASRGLLILPSLGAEDAFVVQAEATTGKAGIEVRTTGSPLGEALLPEAVVRYVMRTRENVILDDASDSPLFSNDEYVRRHPPLSVLCLPLLQQGTLRGVIYLENRLTSAAFTADRLALLVIIAAQAAVSLENARLYAALTEERTRLEAVIEQVPVGLVITEASTGRVITANQQVLDILQAPSKPASHVRDYNALVGYHADGRPYAQEEWPLIRAVTTGEPVRGEELKVVRDDGTEIWIAVSATALRNASGAIATGVATMEDVTERRRREAALRASEERFSKAFHNNPTPMLVVRQRDWTVMDANQSLLETLDLVQDELVGKPLPESSPWLMTLTARTDGGGTTTDAGRGQSLRNQELVAPTTTKGRRTLLVSSEGITLDQEACLLISMVDVTERKAIEEKLRQAQKMEAVGSLAGGVAHDFNNLLTIINGYSELALIDIDPADRNRDTLRRIREAGERASLLTRKLLAFSRKQDVKRVPVSINAVVTEMEDMLRRLIEQDVGISVHLERDLHTVNADRGEIGQLLMNLIVNARDAMPRGGMVKVETMNVVLDEQWQHAPDTLLGAPAGAYVMLSVTDTGFGMPANVRGKIFEPFFTTKEPGKGTGLGLAVVYQIVQSMGGGISVTSEVEQGSTFRLYLPALREGATERAAAGERDVQSLRGDARILVVDDEEPVRRLASLSLQRLGYRVVDAANGRDALQLIESGKEPFDLVITDLMMPEVGGRELTRQLRTAGHTVPILFMSGSARADDIVRGLGEDAKNLITKPFDPLALGAAVRGLLRANKTVRPS